MTQTMSVIDNLAFLEFVKAFDSELNNDLQVCSTDSYNIPLAEIDSEKNCLKRLCHKPKMLRIFPKK